MIPVAFPGWKKIGWHVGKKLRDILHPPQDTGPSKEQRLAQRLRDAMKGFAYFNEFDEVESWNCTDVDPLQIANTPLLERSATSTHDSLGPKSNIILCHDYQGGYHGYESVRPDVVDVEWYSCEYLQYVEAFIYFSHSLVCIPPPTWTNTLHRNGVKALATFIVEPQTPEIERILHIVDGKYVYAKQMAQMAESFGFDGWLLNIENEFPKSSQNLTGRLTDFIRSLKEELGNDRQVIWYDALNTENKVKYQNGLSIKNLAFAQAADGLFTNYKWSDSKLREAESVALQHGLKLSDIYFGIDVWAQNINTRGPPRITYPVEGGGGTNTGLVRSPSICLAWFWSLLFGATACCLSVAMLSDSKDAQFSTE